MLDRHVDREDDSRHDSTLTADDVRRSVFSLLALIFFSGGFPSPPYPSPLSSLPSPLEAGPRCG